MARIITVKGIGKASAKPDYVEISMSLHTRDKNYDRAMDLAGQHIQHLTETISAIGFAKSDLKTASFNVRTDYQNVKDRNGNYNRVFNGYVVDHSLKLEFDFDMQKLSQALSAIAGCLSNPDLSIRFTVKDASGMNEEMLRSAAVNARRKAEILCEASGVKLGQLMNVDYNWGELEIYSKTQYRVAEECMPYAAAPTAINIEPDDIDVSDTVTFVWEIES
ncbi:MAG: SIMPL domain-containing protein [Lachnospiraceae bacterium]|nr:SIMPL domain-containing protein [Lachnospiraceae bacterium]